MPLQANDSIGPYILIRQLGRGAFGEVWLVRHHHLDEERAMKVPTDPAYVRQLRTEAKIQFRLNHPNIVRTLDLIPDHDPPYYVMEYVAGVNLRLKMRASGKLPPTEACQILRQILLALEHAHAASICHRDLKPENVLCQADGVVKVTDFGFGKVQAELAQSMILSGSLANAGGGSITGTVQYMSPQQQAGEEADPRDDLYAVGVIACELLTGSRPQPMGVTKMLERAGADVTFSIVLEKAMEEDRKDRYGSAAEMRDGLDEFSEKTLVHTMVPWPSHEGPANVPQFQQNRPANLPPRQGTRPANVPPPQGQQGEGRRPTASMQSTLPAPDATVLPAIRRTGPNLRPASVLPMSGVAVQAPLAPDATPAAEQECRAGNENATVTGAPAGEAVSVSDSNNEARPPLVLRHEERVTSAAFSPDGTRVVTACYDHTARVWDTATGKPLGEPMRHEGSVGSAAFSPDGTRVVTNSHDDTARVWDAATGKPLGESMRHRTFEYSASIISPLGGHLKFPTAGWCWTLWDSAAFSPDGKRVVTASAFRNMALVWDAATGKPLGKPMRHGTWVQRWIWPRIGQVTSADFSPDGKRLVTASSDKTARMWDAVTGERLGEPMWHGEWVNSAAFSPDGTRVVTASNDHTGRVWDAATGTPLGKPMRHEGLVTSAAFSPDGTRVVTASRDKTARVWDAATGEPRGEPMRHEGSVVSAAFSPEGTRVVTVSWDDKTARLWDAATGKPLGEPMRHAHPVTSAAFSPNGTRVVTASGNMWDNKGGEARVWVAASGKPLGEPMRHEKCVNSAAFNRDGTRVVTASDDGTARVWDVAATAPLAPFYPPAPKR